MSGDAFVLSNSGIWSHLREQIPQKTRGKGREILSALNSGSSCPHGICGLKRGLCPGDVNLPGWPSFLVSSSWNTQVQQWSQTGVWSFHPPVLLHLSEEAAGGPQTQTQIPEVQKPSPLQTDTQETEYIFFVYINLFVIKHSQGTCSSKRKQQERTVNIPHSL